MMLWLKSPDCKWPCPECSDPVGSSAVICELEPLPCRTAEDLILELTLTQELHFGLCDRMAEMFIAVSHDPQEHLSSFWFVFSCCCCHCFVCMSFTSN